MPQSNRIEAVNVMLSQEVDLSAEDDGSGAEITAEDRGVRGFGSLHRAAAGGDAKQVKGLVTQGASVNERDWAGRSPLHIACYYAHVEATRVLLDLGSDPNARDNHCRTPLFYAVAGLNPVAGAAETVQTVSV